MSTTAQGKKLLSEWQKRLGLTEWHIILEENCRPEDMAIPEVEGCTTWVESTRCAWVDMLDPTFYPPKAISRVQDVDNDLQKRYMHQMIDDLARAFVDAKQCKDGD